MWQNNKLNGIPADRGGGRGGETLELTLGSFHFS